ncbi:MAG: 3-phosphoshikimate 1-carboxyvinyltransferase, partial [Gammaproteobacteria bacterium]
MNLVSHPINSMSGEVDCPGDKSISQRILILGSFLNCDMEIDGFLDADDPNSTLDALNKLGASIRRDAKRIYLKKRSITFCNPSEDLNLGNSGTGARLLLGLISGLGIKSRLVGDHSLSNRPMSRVISPLLEMGANIESKEGTLPITTNACKINDDYEYLMPLASAQVKSCLLLAALASKNNIKITEPKITRDHTERMIEFFGGEISYGNETSFGQIELKNRDLSTKDYYIVPGDFSSASFIIVASI